jgi:ATP-binding protein involved in chromosome partitioning
VPQRAPTSEDILESLADVDEPELERPITDLGMVADIDVDDATVTVGLKLAFPGAPSQDVLVERVVEAVGALGGVATVEFDLEPLSEDERQVISRRLRAERGQTGPSGQGDESVFARAGSATKVISIASGKGGVGKSSVTVNLAAALADEGYAVGVLDADIYGYSVPRMLGVTGRPIGFEGLVMPLRGHGCKVISIGFFLPDPDRPVMWRGPMLHRALQQFLNDVWWGDLDFLLCDLPPGTGDIAISLGQMLPNADLVVVTTPQDAAGKVAVRAGQMAEETGMQVAGVIENMATFTCPECGTSHDIFGSGAGEDVAEALETELLGRVPIDPRLREGADAGTPLVLSHPDVPAAQALGAIARDLAKRSRSVVGKSLPLIGA